MGAGSGVATTSETRPDPAKLHAFVVRLWWEPAVAVSPGEWRGTVLHVPSSASLSFRGLDGLPAAVSGLIASLEAR